MQDDMTDIKQAIEIFKSKGIKWKELRSADEFYNKIQKQLFAQQETNLFDVCDMVNMLLFEVCAHGNYAKLGSSIKRILEDRGELKDQNSPNFENLMGASNDDDQAPAEDVMNDMGSVAGPDMGPGSDMHIAAMDLLEKEGQLGQDIFEFSLAGESIKSISEATGKTEDVVKKAKQRVIRHLKNAEHTLDGTNRRLGTGKVYDAGKTFFPASRNQESRNWDLPEVDHRNTTYVDESMTRPAYPSTVKITPDHSQGIKSTGDGVGNTGLGYETNIGPDRLLPEDASEVQHGTKMASWKTYPNGVDNRQQFSQYGDPAKWQPRRDSDESIQKMCNEIFKTYAPKC